MSPSPPPLSSLPLPLSPFQSCWCPQAGYLQLAEQYSPLALIPPFPPLSLCFWICSSGGRLSRRTREPHATSHCKYTNVRSPPTQRHMCTHQCSNISTKLEQQSARTQTPHKEQHRGLHVCTKHRTWYWLSLYMLRALSEIQLNFFCHKWALQFL